MMATIKANGSLQGNYTGTVKQNIPHGVGRVIDNKLGNIYEGQFKDGKCHGYFRMIFAGGSYWIGLQNEGMWASNRKYRPNNTLWECFNC